jgi:hypothetical protein
MLVSVQNCRGALDGMVALWIFMNSECICKPKTDWTLRLPYTSFVSDFRKNSKELNAPESIYNPFQLKSLQISKTPKFAQLPPLKIFTVGPATTEFRSDSIKSLRIASDREN